MIKTSPEGIRQSTTNFLWLDQAWNQKMLVLIRLWRKGSLIAKKQRGGLGGF